MGCYVLGFPEIDQTQVVVVGGKGAHLGELSRIEGVRVPVGFCVTTDAFRRIMAGASSIDDRLDRLSRLNLEDKPAVSRSTPAVFVDLTNGPYTFDAPVTVAGEGTLRTSQPLTLNTDIAPTHLDLRSPLDGGGNVTIPAGGALSMAASATLQGSGLVTIKDGGMLDWVGGIMSGSGTTVVDTGATLTVPQNSSPRAIFAPRTLTNHGAATMTGGIVVGDGSFRNLGNFTITGDSAISGSVVNTGTLTKSGTATSTIGPLSNDGVIEVRTGTLSAAQYSQGIAGQLRVTLGGTDPGSGYGVLATSGNASLTGALSINLAPGFTPASGSTYHVITYATRSGAFDTITDPAGGPVFAKTYNNFNFVFTAP